MTQNLQNSIPADFFDEHDFVNEIKKSSAKEKNDFFCTRKKIAKNSWVAKSRT